MDGEIIQNKKIEKKKVKMVRLLCKYRSRDVAGLITRSLSEQGSITKKLR